MKLSDVDSVVELGRWLQARGITPSEHRAFGGVDTDAHSKNSLHYQRVKDGRRYFPADKQGTLALDVNDNDVRNTAIWRLRRGQWRLWRPTSETDTLYYVYDRILRTAQQKGWPLNEMFFGNKGFRVETGYGSNRPIGGHATHLHVGFDKARW